MQNHAYDAGKREENEKHTRIKYGYGYIGN